MGYDTYAAYLENQDQYINLKKALEYFEIVDSHLQVFLASLNESSGDDVTYTFETFGDVKEVTSKNIAEIPHIISTLEGNAARGDVVLSRWKAKANRKYAYKTVDSEVSQTGTSERTINNSQVTVYSFTGTRKRTIVVSAGIGSDGYIEVHTKNEIITYTYTSQQSTISFSQLASNGTPSTTEEEGPTLHVDFNDSII